MVRLAHLSDVHVTAPRLAWRPRDWASKRLSAWVNFRWLGRRRRFRQAEHVLERLRAELPGRGVEHVVFSGDATALGFEAEFARAAHALGVDGAGLPGIAVPGNHDYCTLAAARAGYFEHYFAPWQEGRRVDGQRYPFAQRVGPLWLVGVNGATGNRLPWDASGRVGPDQLARLETLLRELEPGPRVLVIHFPVVLASGQREAFGHGLNDVRHVVEVAARGGVRLWLHGHRHGPYHLRQTPWGDFPVICAGSATQADICSYNEYVVEGDELHAIRRVYDEKRAAFTDVETFHLPLAA